MEFLFTWGFLGLLSFLIPCFAGFINWFFLFPVASLTFGCLAWCGLYLFGFVHTMDSIRHCILLIGMPTGIFVAKVANAD